MLTPRRSSGCHRIGLFLILIFSLSAVAQKASSAKKNAEAAAPALAADSTQQDLTFKGMKYRLVGPFRGGRALTASGIPGDATTYYFGSTGGGVWKSTDGALTWKPVFDQEGTSAIGSLAVSPSDPSIVYVGTGEACLRGNISQGDGIYKTLDGGKTWKNTGLRDSRAIGKVIVNPKNPDIVFVAALGHPFGANPERGIFRTLDGGKTWEKVLYKDENTGGVDVAFDPHNPNVLYAALWQVRRYPWKLDSGGAGSGLYRSNDGGATWKHLEEKGLPKGPYGRIGVSVAANSDRVYALIEAAEGGLYRSDDGGDTWQLVNASHSLIQRPWYYMHVIADPQDADTVYVMNVDAYSSTDGGRSFNKIHNLPHGDNHGLWIDPVNPRRMIATNDGGATVTLDGGKTWSREDNQPTAQFYHVIADTRTPYYIYGAQQDNSTVGIATRSDHGSIDRSDWYPVGGGEAGYIAPYPPDPNIVYAADYEGMITRYDHSNGQLRNITNQTELTDAGGAANLQHRFQWTSPVLISPHDPEVLYHAGEQLFKTTDGGTHWEAISPDLTRNDKSKQQPSGGAITIDDTGTEYYDTIFAVAESPVTKGVIWAGTDDGLIQLTRDGGKTWSNVTPKDLPEWSRVSQIEASPFDAGTAYVAIDRHQNDDLRPYIWKTADYGKTWTQGAKGIPETTFVRAVREDPKKRGLLYAGTESGVYVSFNDGAEWRSLQLNLPRVPIHDLIVKNDDLVLATHGRSFWILDDVSPLRQYRDEIAKESVHLYTPATAYRIHNPERPPRHASLAGINPPSGAVIDFFVKEVPKGETRIDIVDAQGQRIRSFSSLKTIVPDEPLDPEDKKPEKEIKVEAGLNRFIWDLHYERANRVPGYSLWEYNDGAEGPLALPGDYQVRLTVDGQMQTARFEVKLDPRVHTTQAELEQQFQMQLQIREQLNRIYTAVNQIEDVRAQTEALKRRLPAEDGARPLRASADGLSTKLVSVREPLINLKISANEDSLAYRPGLDGQWAFLGVIVGSGCDCPPTEAARQRFDQLKRATDEAVARWDELQKSDVAAFQKMAANQGIYPVEVPAPNSSVSAGQNRRR